jgi:hypothetical protein
MATKGKTTRKPKGFTIERDADTELWGVISPAGDWVYTAEDEAEARAVRACYQADLDADRKAARIADMQERIAARIEDVSDAATLAAILKLMGE